MTEPNRPPFRRKIEAIVLWIITASCCAGVLLLTGSTFVPDLRPSLDDTVEVPKSAGGSDPSAISVFKETPSDSEYAVLVVTLEKLNQESMSVNATIAYFVPESWKKAVHRGFESILMPETEEHKGLHERIKPQFREETILIQFSDRYSRALVPIRVRLVDLFTPPLGNQTGQPDYSTTIELPLSAGQSSLYPSDWYAFDHHVFFELSGSLSAWKDKAFHFHFPTEVKVQRGDGLRSYDLVLEQADGHPGAGSQCTVQITNDYSKIVFVYCMALAPLVLILLFGHYLFLHPMRENVTVHESVLEASGLILALLPVRSILVGSEFAQITNVDRVLACGILLVVAFTTGRYAMSLWKVKHSGNKSPEQSC